MLSFLKIKLRRFPRLILQIRLVRKVTFESLFVNFLFQRLLRRNSSSNFSVHFTSTVSDSGIKLNKDLATLASFAASGGCYFQAINGIVLGQNFLFAPGVKLISGNHSYAEDRKTVKSLPIVIGNNVWLGANCIILPEVSLGDNTVVGAGSVVTKSFPEGNLVIAGNPAKIIKDLSL